MSGTLATHNPYCGRHTSPRTPSHLAPPAPTTHNPLLPPPFNPPTSSEWLEAKAKRADNEGRTQASLQAQMEAELEWVRSNAKGQQKKGKARLRRYDDLVEEAASYVRAASVDTITIPTGPRLGGVVLEVDGAAKGFGERKLFEGLSFSVPPGACVGVVGGNGVGKSTLFKMVMGMEAPDAGTITLGETVKPMYVDQSRDSLNPDATVVDEISGGRDVIPVAGRDVNARQYCRRESMLGRGLQGWTGGLNTYGRAGAPASPRPAPPVL